jgi:hypothetical protein
MMEEKIPGGSLKTTVEAMAHPIQGKTKKRELTGEVKASSATQKGNSLNTLADTKNGSRMVEAVAQPCRPQ